MNVAEKNLENADQDAEMVPEGADMQQQIANLAYALWQQRGQPSGTSELDWTEAEGQIRSWGESLTATAR